MAALKLALAAASVCVVVWRSVMGQSRLAVGDVEAGHGGLSIGVKNPPSWPT